MVLHEEWRQYNRESADRPSIAEDRRMKICCSRSWCNQLASSQRPPAASAPGRAEDVKGATPSAEGSR
eukprot:2307719-Pyramimonas_sp.AAC.1